MEKRELEMNVVELAKPLLEKLYGKCSVDDTQTDKPDAAITVWKPHKRFGHKANPFRVGIEITTVEKEQDLAYLNDGKYGRDKVLAQTMDALEKGIVSPKPIKKIEIEITESYIYDGAIRKKEKYLSYLESGTYREVILLCFSDVVKTSRFKSYLQNYTNYRLSVENFPFDAVVFVSRRSGDAVRVYRKKEPLHNFPEQFDYPRWTETIVCSQVFLFGKEFNYNEMMSEDPEIAKRESKPARESSR
jgi:hypothetical protein